MTNKLIFQLDIKKKRGDYSIISLPQTNQYQKIENVHYKVKSTEIIKEKKWENRVVVFRLNDVVDSTSLSFYSSSFAINRLIPSAFELDHYTNIHYSLTPDSFVNGKDPEIVKLAKSSIGTETNLANVVKNLYLFTLEHLNYGKPTDGLYSYKQAMEEITTDCGGFSTFLISLLQSLGIPSRLVVGFLIKNNRIKDVSSLLRVTRYKFQDLSMHAWLEVLLPDKNWFPLDPSIEWRRKKGLTKREGGFGQIPADRLVLSYGQEFTFNIDKKKFQIDLLQHPIYL